MKKFYTNVKHIHWYKIIPVQIYKEVIFMGTKSTKLGDGELEVMQAIWDAGKPVTAGSIIDRVQETRTWGLSTLMTVLARLIEKGFLVCDKSTRNNIYTAIIGEEEYKKKESRSFFKKLHKGSLSSFVSCLYDGEKLSEEDIDELKRFIDMAGKEE